MKILIVDDHELFRAGLRLLLLTIDKQAMVLEAATIHEALAAAGQHPDLRLCLLDLALKGERGVDAIARIKAAAPEVAMVVVSALEKLATVHECIDAGAMSFVSKSAAPHVLMEALQQVLEGKIYLPKQIFSDTPGRAIPAPKLTPRQQEVFRELSLGLPVKTISRKLDISENTVNEHIAAIYLALGVHNRTQAIIAMGRLGLRFDR